VEESGNKPIFSEKLKLALKASGALARNPKALAALAKYKISERKSARKSGGTA
jgi:hypothetical protein